MNVRTQPFVYHFAIVNCRNACIEWNTDSFEITENDRQSDGSALQGIQEKDRFVVGNIHNFHFQADITLASISAASVMKEQKIETDPLADNKPIKVPAVSFTSRRRQSSWYGFSKILRNGKTLARCDYCMKTINNTAKARLEAHR